MIYIYWLINWLVDWLIDWSYMVYDAIGSIKHAWVMRSRYSRVLSVLSWASWWLKHVETLHWQRIRQHLGKHTYYQQPPFFWLCPPIFHLITIHIHPPFLSCHPHFSTWVPKNISGSQNLGPKNCCSIIFPINKLPQNYVVSLKFPKIAMKMCNEKNHTSTWKHLKIAIKMAMFSWWFHKIRIPQTIGFPIDNNQFWMILGYPPSRSHHINPYS